MRDTFDVRCPVCLRQKSVAKTTSVFESLSCNGCGSSFELQNALPAVKEESAAAITNTTILENHDKQIKQLVVGAALLAVIFFVAAVPYSNTLDGSGFLLFLVVVFLITFAGSFVIRALWLDSNVVRIVAFLLFESLCVYRLIWGYSHGMHDFNSMLMAMVIGGMLYFAHWDGSRSQGSGGAGTGGGCGGGCSGGCGGCGG